MRMDEKCMDTVRPQESKDSAAGRAQLETFINTLAIDIFDDYTQTKDADQTVRKLLEMTGSALRVSRAAVFEYGDSGISMTYGWNFSCGKSVKKHNLAFDTDRWKQWAQYAHEDHVIVVNDCNSATINEAERDYWLHDDVKALMICFFYRDGAPAGCIYADCLDGPREWTDQEKEALKAVAKIFNVYLFNMRQLQHLEDDRLLTHAIDKNQEFYTYALKGGSYEILYVDDHIRKSIPAIKTGDLCYEVFKKRDSPCPECPITNPATNNVSIFSPILNTWGITTTTPIKLNNGEEAMLVCFTDVTDYNRKQAGRLDTLTGLPVLSLFKSQADTTLQEKNGVYALCYLDFDDFGAINHKKGIEAGDLFLREFAAHIKKQTNVDELVCRYFSDVFLLLLFAESEEEARIRTKITYENLREWCDAYFEDFRLRLKCGVCLSTSTGAVEDMIDNAATAVNTLHGSEGYAVFGKEMHEQVERLKMLEDNMEDALSKGEFVVYLQPVVDLKTGKIAGAEAILRWRRPSVGMIMPDEFTPIFEKSGFIRKTDDYSILRIVEIIQGWRREGLPLIPISVHISEQSIRDRAFAEKLIHSIQEYDIPPRLIQLELNERLFDSDEEELDAMAIIHCLRKEGVAFVVDRFGKGASPIDMMQGAPVDILKMDKSFLKNPHLSEKERAMITHLIRLAKSLDMRVMSVGVETYDHADFLQDAGGDLAQGYYYGGPVKVESFQKKMLTDES